MHINNIKKVNASTYRHRVQTRRFARQYKKLHDNVATDVDDAVELIARKPSIGERKKVTWLIVCLQISQSRATLSAGYTLDDGVQLVYLKAIGPHENFYRDLKR